MPIITSIRTETVRGWAATSRGAAIAAVVLGVVGLAGLFLWNGALANVQAFPGEATPLAINGASTKYPANFRTIANAAIGAAPLDQARLNALYVFEARPGGDAAHARRLLTILERTGWRDTAAQRNLITAAAHRNDLAEVAARADGLLRRQRLEPAMLDILHALEADPASRPLLIPHLARNPLWRTRFFSDLSGRDALDARTAMINLMFDRRMKLESREIAPVVTRLIEAGQMDRAYALAQRNRGRSPAATGLSDTDFKDAALRAEIGDTGFVPFEWQFGQSQDFEASAERTGVGADVNISWNGSGVPVFMRQRFKIRPGRYGIRIAGLDAKPELLRNLAIAAECPGVLVNFDKPDSARPGGLSLAGDQPIPCAYPELRVAAQLRENHTGFDLSLASITLVPLKDKAL
jgi:hypothetical protein